MKHITGALLLVLLTLAAPLAMGAAALGAGEVSGTIEICRVSAAGDRHQGKAIEIPQGATFGDAGMLADGKRTGIYWPLWLATTEKVTLGAEDKCVSGRARITANLDHHALHSADRRWFVPSGTATNPREDWPADYEVAATVTADFR